MDRITVPMALMDMIPVVLFNVVAVVLYRGLHKKMSGSQTAFFLGGAFMVGTGGALKALWKLLYAMEVCDYQLLSEQLFVTQGLGFLFIAIAFTGLIFTNKHLKNRTACVAAVIPVVTTKLPFILMTFFGTTWWYVCIAVIAVRLRKFIALPFLILAYIAIVFNAALGSSFERTSGIMNWVGQFVNTAAQAFLLLAALHIRKEITAYDSSLEYGSYFED